MAAQEAITILQPKEDWLKHDDNLVTLIKSVANSVQDDLLHERPMNTAKIYLALFGISDGRRDAGRPCSESLDRPWAANIQGKCSKCRAETGSRD
jgi:hypothetical protein